MAARWHSPEEAAGRVRRRDAVALPLGPGHPRTWLRALGERDDFEELVVFGALLPELFPLFARPGVTLLSGFFGPAERALAAAGQAVAYVPADFRRFSRIARALRPRVMATAVAPGEREGEYSLSLHAGATVEELHRCGADPERLLVAEMDRALPCTRGLPPEHPHLLRADEIDVLLESEQPPFEIPETAATPEEERIAEHALRLVQPGSTLQVGIGGVPDRIAGLLAAGPGGDYGIHTEMFTTGLMRLHRAGKVSNRKGFHDGYSVATFAAGTRELYEWLDHNDEVRFLPVQEVNAPEKIARNRAMVSVNGALAVDLFGQVAADTVPGAHFSGAGGAEDFAAGAGLRGRSLVCLPSTSCRDGSTHTRIHPVLPPGMLVTTPRHQVDAIVTEHGVAELLGRSEEERAERLIAVAAPELREELREGWRRLRPR